MSFSSLSESVKEDVKELKGVLKEDVKDVKMDIKDSVESIKEDVKEVKRDVKERTESIKEDVNFIKESIKQIIVPTIGELYSVVYVLHWMSWLIEVAKGILKKIQN